MSTKSSIGSLLLAGAAAYGLYKLLQMKPEERLSLVQKGKRIVTDQVGSIKSLMGRNGSSPNARINSLAADVTYGG